VGLSRGHLRPYDVGPEGQRFVMIEPVSYQQTPVLTLVDDWASLLP